MQTMLTGEKLKAKARAEKANKLKTKMNKSKHKLRQVKLEDRSFSNNCFH